MIILGSKYKLKDDEKYIVYVDDGAGKGQDEDGDAPVELAGP